MTAQPPKSLRGERYVKVEVALHSPTENNDVGWFGGLGVKKEGVMGYSTAIFWLQHQSSHNRC